MKITHARLKRLIEEEVREILDLKMLKYYDEDKDWGEPGGRFDAAKLRSQLPASTLEELEDDHIEVAIRDAIHDGLDSEEFATSDTLKTGMNNRDAITDVLGNTVEELWNAWEGESH